MQMRLLLSVLVVASCFFGPIANAAEIHTLVCVDEANGTLVFADGSMYKIADRECNKLCPKGLPVNCTILRRVAMSADPDYLCCEISNAVTKESVLAVRVNTAHHQK